MEYIAYKDFSGKAIFGAVNIPKGTTCTENNGIIYLGDSPICAKTSQRAFDYFARNNDGEGLKRGELVTNIKETLAMPDEHHEERWHRVWDSPVCRQFNRGGDYWNWNYAFYNADIHVLEYIYKLITDENWVETAEPTTTDTDAKEE